MLKIPSNKETKAKVSTITVWVLLLGRQGTLEGENRKAGPDLSVTPAMVLVIMVRQRWWMVVCSWCGW